MIWKSNFISSGKETFYKIEAKKSVLKKKNPKNNAETINEKPNESINF